jgi:hypothetical protein
MILGEERAHFLEQHEANNLCNGDAVCFLISNNCSFITVLNTIQVSNSKEFINDENISFELSSY